MVAPESRRVTQQRDTSDRDGIEGERRQVLEIHAMLGRINDLKLHKHRVSRSMRQCVSHDIYIYIRKNSYIDHGQIEKDCITVNKHGTVLYYQIINWETLTRIAAHLSPCFVVEYSTHHLRSMETE